MQPHGILTHLGAWSVGLVATVAIPLALPLIKKWAAGLVGARLIEAMNTALSAGDADDDVVVLAVVKWVEVKSAKLGVQGEGRLAVVARELCAKVPVLSGREAAVQDLLVALVKAAEDAAKSVEAAQQPK
jgi:hypothetical protein